MNFDLELSLQGLARTPGVLHALLDGLPDPWTRSGEGPDTFSPFDVVGHLIDGEETDWVPLARIILDGGPNPLFEPYDRFRHRARNAGRTLGSLLEEFDQLRRANLALIRSWQLTPASLELPASIPAWDTSRSASSWQPGSCMTSDTSLRLRESWPSNSARRRGPGRPSCRCSPTMRLPVPKRRRGAASGADLLKPDQNGL